MTDILLMNAVIASSAALYCTALFVADRHRGWFWGLAVLHAAFVLIGFLSVSGLPLTGPAGDLRVTVFILRFYGPPSVLLGQIDYHLLRRLRMSSE